MERRKQALNVQVYEEAGEFFLEFRDGEPTAHLRGEFNQWLRRSPEHLAAYLEIAAVWNEAPTLQSVNANALIERARQGDDNVLTLSGQEERHRTTGKKKPRWTEMLQSRALKAASFLIVAGAAAVLWATTYKPAYSTGVGEQRRIWLRDGSTIELNTKSELRVRYTNEMRSVELIAGQALFRVEKDPNRPFVVTSGDVRVRAIGTQFDVYRKAAATVVTVVEGKVDIRERPEAVITAAAAKPPGTGTLATTGQQVMVMRSTISPPVAANVGNAIAWTRQQLAFDGTSLSEIAEEFNRYNERKLVIRDRSLAEFRVSGVFSSSNPAGLLRFLRDRPGIEVSETSSQILVDIAKETRAEK